MRIKSAVAVRREEIAAGKVVKDGMCPDWIDASPLYENDWASILTIYHKLSQLHADPGPSGLFLFIDEKEGDETTGAYYVSMTASDTYYFAYRPASSHNNSASFTFVDGHSEAHKWREASTVLNLRGSGLFQPIKIRSGYSGMRRDPSCKSSALIIC
jgi:prepilin-type processing-associated H-X9-DG protein